jgi:hypothetical protein
MRMVSPVPGSLTRLTFEVVKLSSPALPKRLEVGFPVRKSLPRPPWIKPPAPPLPSLMERMSLPLSP